MNGLFLLFRRSENRAKKGFPLYYYFCSKYCEFYRDASKKINQGTFLVRICDRRCAYIVVLRALAPPSFQIFHCRGSRSRYSQFSSPIRCDIWWSLPVEKSNPWLFPQLNRFQLKDVRFRENKKKFKKEQELLNLISFWYPLNFLLFVVWSSLSY